MPKTYYLSNNLLNHILRGVSYAAPSTVYVVLFTVTPTVNTSGTEVAPGTGYIRVPATFAPASNGTVANVADVVFPTATGGDWGQIVAYGFSDSLAGGNLLYYSALTPFRTVLDTDQLVFPAGRLTCHEA